jgi:hypothetical protein
MKWRSSMTWLASAELRLRISVGFLICAVITPFLTDRQLVAMLDIVGTKFGPFDGTTERIAKWENR